MGNIAVVLMSLVLMGLVIYSLWNTSVKREGLNESYEERTCLSLAQQNEEKMMDLEKKMKEVLALQGDVTGAKTTSEANTKMLLQIIETNNKK